MPVPLTGDIISLHTSFYTLSSHFNNMYNDCLALGTALTAEGNPSSAAAANNMAVHIYAIRNDIAQGATSTRYWLVKCLQWIDGNWGGGVVDMAGILTAMWNAKGGQPLTFINYVDAMRGSCSEKAVYGPYLESYMRHFLYL